MFNRICQLPGCTNEFSTNKENKVYCCVDHYRKGNSIKERQRQKQKRTCGVEKYPCIMCGQKRNNEKYRYCISCRENIRQWGIVDTINQEHKIYG